MSSSNITVTSDTSSYSTRFSTPPQSNQITSQKGSIFLIVDHNKQNIITSNKIRLTLEISNLIISEGLSSNLSQKPRFKKVRDLARNVSTVYQHPNRNIIPKDLLDLINDYNMDRNLSFIKRESDFFGFIFLGDGATISIIPLFNIFSR